MITFTIQKYVKCKARRISFKMAHHRYAIVFGRKYFAKEEKIRSQYCFKYNMRRRPLQDGPKTRIHFDQKPENLILSARYEGYDLQVLLDNNLVD
jgi:hypothetical protein